MKFKTNIRVSVLIIFMFGIAVIISGVADRFHVELGDWHCNGKIAVTKYSPGGYSYIEKLGCQYDADQSHIPQWHWGWRHWLIGIGGLCLFILNFITVICIIVKNLNTN